MLVYDGIYHAKRRIRMTQALDEADVARYCQQIRVLY